ncbi:methionine/alanine import family NSS transporter small subunit [Schaalia sp. ZJ405]|uniref:methionine/alanine import family NSS transporter small subunit n=1 Tax=unclassified Schaalia TaxID=2691889 RepID=UPI0013EE35E5|nr:MULTISPECIES: methionine/alanine import family NSS transporter small subunit [unclassified Schaalia]QPK80562.1 methionine/alanine import family NSS transporter small subunit [Schaalia sp. ZJ405]
MSAIAVFIMVLTILLVWGGLVASVVLLQVLPVPSDEETERAQAELSSQAADRS